MIYQKIKELNVKEHCNTCWFCQERLWGFGKMA
jgi:hypothetical protein